MYVLKHDVCRNREFIHMAHCVYVYVQVFLDEVSKVKGFAVRFDHGTDVKTAAAAQSDAPNPASPKTEKLETIEQMQSMVYQAQQNHGFCIGTMVVDKEDKCVSKWFIDVLPQLR